MQLRSNFYNNQILFIFGADDVCLLEMLQIGGFFYEFPGITNKNLKNVGTPNTYLLTTQS